ncbi:hypothetical protein [Actinoplanes sp. NPDC051859]|uniref:hypothetical protein n=1 Tax=Actinoplanes sp. NPDC051859 TaxID=3363909 RepID=UPI0037AEAEDE
MQLPRHLGVGGRQQATLRRRARRFLLGDKTEALDSGAPNGVFATAGGYTYLLVTGLVVGGAAAAVGRVFVIRNAFRRRRVAEPVP